MKYSEWFGFAAAFGWALSCIITILATKVAWGARKGDLIRASALEAYFKKTGSINATAAAISSIAAALSAAAIFCQTKNW